MPLFQFIWTAAVIVAFLVIVFWVAWYIAVPLLLLLFFCQGIIWIRSQWNHRREKQAANGCIIRRTRTIRQTPDGIIDVDYIEVK